MADKFKSRYRIPSARLSSWDYSSNGSYFITICTANRQHFFGKIEKNRMQLSKIGEFANQCWLNIPSHFPHFYLSEFIVMPNHLHGIVLIEKPYIDNNSLNNVVEAGHSLSLRQTNTRKPNETIPRHPRFRNQGRNTISSMVGSFKSAVTKYCNENKLGFGWQSRFHDHIIRNTEEFYAIKNYIKNNILNWKDDSFMENKLMAKTELENI